MRRALTLRVVLGLAVLFAVAYLTAPQAMAPVELAQLERAASAEAEATALKIAMVWDDRKQAAHDVARTLADTPAIRSLGDEFSQRARRRGLKRALEGAVLMAGARGQAVLLDEAGEQVVEIDGAASLVGTQAAKAALQGQSVAIVEATASEIMMVAAAPVDVDEDHGALVVGVPLKAENQSELLKGIAPGVAVAVLFGGRPVFGTLPIEATEAIGSLSVEHTANVLGKDYRISKLPLAHDGSAPVSVVALAALRSPVAATATGQFRFVLLLLGVFALIVAVVGTMSEAPAPMVRTAVPRRMSLEKPRSAPRPAAPVDLPEEAEEPSASSDDVPWDIPEPPTEEPGPSPAPELRLNFGGSSPQTKPMGPTPLPDVEAQEAGQVDEPDSPHSHGFAREDADSASMAPLDPLFASGEAGSSPTLRGDSTGLPAPSSRKAPSVVGPVPSDVFSNPDVIAEEPDPSDAVPLPPSAAAMGAQEESYQQSPFLADGAPGEPPDDEDHFALDEQFTGHSPVGASPFGSPSPFAPPEPGGNFREPTPFDRIADAAFAAPPPPPPTVDQRTDLPTPKGPVPPEIKAAQRAEAQRRAAALSSSPMPPASKSSYDPDLPMPKDLPVPTGIPSAAGVPSPFESASLPPPARRNRSVGDAEGAPSGVSRPVALPGAQASEERDPWRNPSVPRMKAPQPPPSSSTADLAPSKPAPFDESHYRLVYQQFIDAKSNLGEPVDNLTFEGFKAKLRSSEESLLDRHGCRAVRFQVLVKDRNVSLRPQLVR